jgi:Na+-driven multidrug efflux pump
VFISSCKSILKIGLPAAGANMLTPIAAAILTAIAATFGEEAVAAFGVGSRIESIASIVILALSMTLPAFISQNFGANKMERVKDSYITAIKFVMFWQILIYVILVLLAPYISEMFAKEKTVADLIVLFIWVLPLGYGLQGIIILTNSSFNALHKPMTTLMLSIVRLFVCYVPISYAGSVLFGLTGFFIGGVIGNLLMAFISFYLFNKRFKSGAFNVETKETSV